MKDKTALALIEQAVMLLVFLLAAALCLRAFAWADSASRHREAADRALTQAQSAAEQIKHRKGDLEAAAASWGGSVDGRGWVITFDEAWTQTENGGCFFLRAALQDTGDPLLGEAKVTVEGENGAVLAALTVCWQEVGQDA